MSACPIWSRDLPAKPAADAAPMFGPIGIRLKRMPDKEWKCAFDNPIPSPSGLQLVTLKEADDYIMKLSKIDQSHKEWQDAIEALILAAEGRRPLMRARIGMLRPLNRHVERVFDPERKPHWDKQKLARDR
jgi:hypothetical protein